MTPTIIIGIISLPSMTAYAGDHHRLHFLHAKNEYAYTPMSLFHHRQSYSEGGDAYGGES